MVSMANCDVEKLVMGTPRRQVEIADLHVECPCSQLPCTLAPQYSQVHCVRPKTSGRCTSPTQKSPTSHTLIGGGQGRRVDGHTGNWRWTVGVGERAGEATTPGKPECRSE